MLGLTQPVATPPPLGLGLGSRLGVNLRLQTTPTVAEPSGPQSIAPGYQQAWPIENGQGIVISARDQAGSYYTVVRNNDRYSIIDSAAATRIAEIGAGEYMALAPNGLVVRIERSGQIMIENSSAYEVVPQPMVTNHVNPSLGRT